MTLFSLGPVEDRPPYEGDLPPDPVSESQARASRDGREFDAEAFDYLQQAGAWIVETYVHVDGYPIDALVEGPNGSRFHVDAHGTPDQTNRPQAGMRRQDTAFKFGYKALHWKLHKKVPRLLLITSHMPFAGTSSAQVLLDLGRANALWDAVAVLGDLAGFQRLRQYFTSDPPCAGPLPAPWRDTQAQLRLSGFEPPDQLGED